MLTTDLDQGCYEAEGKKPEGHVPTILVSAVALIDVDGRVLLSKRPKEKTMAGLWEFPGGKVEKNETPEMALVRELAEELNIFKEHRNDQSVLTNLAIRDGLSVGGQDYRNYIECDYDYWYERGSAGYGRDIDKFLVKIKNA